MDFVCCKEGVRSQNIKYVHHVPPRRLHSPSNLKLIAVSKRDSAVAIQSRCQHHISSTWMISRRECHLHRRLARVGHLLLFVESNDVEVLLLYISLCDGFPLSALIPTTFSNPLVAPLHRSLFLSPDPHNAHCQSITARTMSCGNRCSWCPSGFALLQHAVSQSVSQSKRMRAAVSFKNCTALLRGHAENI